MSGAQVTNNGTQYAVKKRRRPQTKKEKDAAQEGTKTNPSKRHRDRLNTELDHLAKSIPFSDEVLNKLDKLSILRLAVAYFRNKTYHAAELPDNNDLEQMGHGQLLPSIQEQLPFKECESQLALMALHGFIVVVTQDFNIFYVTETVQDYLGFPQCDVMNQSMLDLIHAEDRKIFLRHMQLDPKQAPSEPPQEGDPPTMPEYAKYGFTPDMFRELTQKGMMHRSFICRLRCLLDNSSGFLALHFTGHLRLVPGQNRRGEGNLPLPPENALFLIASPLQTPSILEIRTKNFIFRTKHRLDYTPLGIDAKGKLVLGYSEQQLRKRSGYEFIHSADMMHCADAHTKLMRKGESGLTVFRLLHKNNQWLWVTASARLVFRNGRPDYIISTHRPIPDQEGEDHMKKRSSAFRFDFTGHAVLYGEVNPIGTRGGPEKNPLHEEMEQPEGPSSKKMRMTNGSEATFEDVDRKTLYGALSMQQMDIYGGNLPNQTSEIFSNPAIPATCEVGDITKVNPYENISPPSDNGPMTNDSDVYFYPFADPNPNMHPSPANLMNDAAAPVQMPCTVPQAMMQHNVYNAPMKDINSGLAGPSCSSQEPPPLHHQPINNAASATYQHTNMNSGGYPSPNNSYTGQKRPYPYTKTENSPMQVSSLGKAMPKSENDVQQQPFPTYTNDANHNQGNQQLSSSLYFSQSENQKYSQGHPSNYNFHHKMEENVVANNKFVSNNPSVIEAVTIKSTFTEQQFNPNMGIGQNAHMDINNTGFPKNAPMPLNWKGEDAVIGHQENQIQFDLNKIASAYQTTNPLSKVQAYLQDNPAQAMAIATGLIPEKNMKNINPDKVKAFMPSCQFQDDIVSHNPIDRQREPTRHQPISQKDLFYHDHCENNTVSPSMSVQSNQTMSTNFEGEPELPVNSPGTLLNELGFT